MHQVLTEVACWWTLAEITPWHRKWTRKSGNLQNLNVFRRAFLHHQICRRRLEGTSRTSLHQKSGQNLQHLPKISALRAESRWWIGLLCNWLVWSKSKLRGWNLMYLSMYPCWKCQMAMVVSQASLSDQVLVLLQGRRFRFVAPLLRSVLVRFMIRDFRFIFISDTWRGENSMDS